MTIYYVSQQSGNDGNNGNSVSTPWATMTKAVATAVAGDTVYVGSGLYKEKLTNNVAGTSANPIQFIGDPDSKYLTNDKKGNVRVSGADANDNATTGTVWYCRQDYVTIKNFVLDGIRQTTNSTLLDRGQSSATTYGRINENIVAIGGYYGITGGISEKCISIYASTYSFYYSACNKCILFGRGMQFGSATQCVAILCNNGFDYANPIINCTAYFCNYGFSHQASVINGVAINCNLGFYLSSGSPTYANCIAINCTTGYSYNLVSTSTGTLTQCRQAGCNTVVSVGSGIQAGDAVANINGTYTLNHEIYNKIAESFDPLPIIDMLKQYGDNTQLAGVTQDILGRDRRMLGGLLDVGAYAMADVKPEFTQTYGTTPSISISQIGMKFFELPVSAFQTVTVKVKTKYNANTTGTKPAIRLRGDTITEKVAVNTAGADTWQEISVTATPTRDEVLTLILHAQDPTTGAISYFDAIEVS